jgi:hypothetical protein
VGGLVKEGTKMTRKHSTLILVLATLGAALAATPAAASDQYRSVNSVTGGSAGGASGAGEFSSVNAVTGGGAGEQASSSSFSSVNAAVGSGPSDPSPVFASGDYRSVNAIVGDAATPAASLQPTITTSGADGFDWLDALIGALIASSLLMVSLLAARSVARHRRPTAESAA